MSLCADFDRSIEKMKKAYQDVLALCDGFFDIVRVENEREYCELFKLYDTVITQRSVLSAMILSAESIGSHGSALVDGLPIKTESVRTTRTVTKGKDSFIEDVSKMPEPELWFETLLARKFKGKDKI